MSPSDPSRVRDHPAALDQEGLPPHQQPEQQGVQGLQDRRQEEREKQLLDAIQVFEKLSFLADNNNVKIGDVTFVLTTSVHLT